MIKRLILLMLLLSQISVAQHLKRKGYFGVYPSPVSEEFAKENNLKNKDGIFIQRIVPNSTVANMGIQAQDIILEINKEKMIQMQDLFAMSRQLRDSDKITMKVWRAGKILDLKGKVSPRPFETSANSEIIYGEAKFREGYIRTIINKPKKEGKLPVIYYIQGYPCSSIDNLQAQNPIKQLVEGLAGKDYVVFRAEKSGVGDCQGTPDCNQMDFETEVAGFKAAYEHLLTYDFVDKDNIFIFGHSLGGIVAPYVAEAFKPKGVMVYGTGLQPWHDYLLDIIRIQNPLMGSDPVENAKNIERMRPLLREYFYDKKSPSELAKNPDYKDILTNSVLGFDGKDQITSRHYAFWQNMNDKNHTETWSKVESYVFSIYGEADVAALNSIDHEAIVDVVNYYHKDKAEFYLLPKTNHLLTKVGTMAEGIQKRLSPNFNQYTAQNFNPEIVEVVDKWVKDKLEKEL